MPVALLQAGCYLAPDLVAQRARNRFEVHVERRHPIAPKVDLDLRAPLLEAAAHVPKTPDLLHDEGKTLSEVAEEQGVDADALEETMNASRTETMRERIQQAVEDGNLSQEQADWMLEGLDRGFMGGRRGMGMGRGGFGLGGPFGGDQS